MILHQNEPSANYLGSWAYLQLRQILRPRRIFLWWYYYCHDKCSRVFKHFGWLWGSRGASRIQVWKFISLCPFIDSTKGVQSRPSCTPSRSCQNSVPLWCPLDSWQSAQSWTVCLLARSCDMAGRGRCWPFLDVGTHTQPGKIRIKKSMKPL